MSVIRGLDVGVAAVTGTHLGVGCRYRSLIGLVQRGDGNDGGTNRPVLSVLMHYVAEIGNVAQVWRVFGVSRKTYYEWLKRAEQYGVSALLPKQRRTPHQPNDVSEEVLVILAEAVTPHARPQVAAAALEGARCGPLGLRGRQGAAPAQPG